MRSFKIIRGIDLTFESSIPCAKSRYTFHTHRPRCLRKQVNSTGVRAEICSNQRTDVKIKFQGIFSLDGKVAVVTGSIKVPM